MHPILASRGRLGVYLLAWIPVGAIFLALIVESGGVSWAEGAAVMGPLTLCWAFAALPTWYACRRVPLASGGTKALLAGVSMALVASLFWTILTAMLTQLYSQQDLFPGLDARFASKLPLVFGTGFLLDLLAMAVHYVILEVEGSREAREHEAEARVAARDAELKALKAQINPHFLFNSLHSISALTASDPARARQMCVLLSDFLRSTLGLGEKTSISLGEELTLARTYLAVESVRFGARLGVREEIDPQCAACPVPPLLLQPLVENAVTHGIASLTEGGEIRIEARRSAYALLIAVENDFDAETPPRRKKSGMGLQNVRVRLETRYGKDASLNSGPRDGRFRAELLIPIQSEGEPA